MTKATELLKMIENVDHADSEALDEIDARVWCWLNNNKFSLCDDGFKSSECEYLWYEWNDDGAWTEKRHYTRSRDALKAIRPEGWGCTILIGDEEITVVMFHGMRRNMPAELELWGKKAPTEELAELHAIIQAIEWERENGRGRMETFPIKLDKCPDYILNVQAPNRARAQKIAETLYKAYGREYFVRNGERIANDTKAV